MRKFYVIVAFLTIFPLILCGCGKTALAGAEISRDDEMTGGTLTFDYNKDAREIRIGGEGELISYYAPNISKGWEESGNRIGLKFTAPSGVNEFDTGSLTIQGKTMTAGNFYRTVNGEKIGEVLLYPCIMENEKEFEIKITWQESAEEQIYKIIIVEETRLESE